MNVMLSFKSNSHIFINLYGYSFFLKKIIETPKQE